MNNSVKPESLIQTELPTPNKWQLFFHQHKTLSMVSFVVTSVLVLGLVIGAPIAVVCGTRKKPLSTCFEIKASQIDVENICSCNNGVEAIQDACLNNNDEICTSCNSGFYLSADSCSENMCSCSHGTGATGENCPSNGISLCTACDSGYFLRNDVCVLATNNVCTCGNGVAAVGSACTDDGLEVCVSCDNGYYRLFQGPKRSLH